MQTTTEGTVFVLNRDFQANELELPSSDWIKDKIFAEELPKYHPMKNAMMVLFRFFVSTCLAISSTLTFMTDAILSWPEYTYTLVG